MRTAPVSTTAGRLAGRWQDGVAVFLGVPFASAERWQDPVAPRPWTGVRDADVPGPSAPQPDTVPPARILGPHMVAPLGEDCLNLNIRTPGVDDGRRPVLVWVHGGGFVSGSGALDVYSGDSFARNGDIVAVSVSYRLGPLGFLATGDGANFGIEDQLAALRWIRDNIAAFGGDPDNVTLAGQSAGAYTIAAIMARPESAGLFRRVILHSPPLGLAPHAVADARSVTESYLEALGVPDIAAARELPWPALFEPLRELRRASARWATVAPLFRPALDAPVDGVGANVPVLLGWTREESTFFFGLDGTLADATESDVLGRIGRVFDDRAPDVYRGYAAARPGADPGDVLRDYLTDELIRMPSLRFAETRNPVWAYQFNLPSPAFDGRLGATHGIDLPFAFGNLPSWSYAPLFAEMTGTREAGLAGAMHRAWISFVRTGDPNHGDLPAWRRYDVPSRSTMVFDGVSAGTGDPAGHWRDLWAGIQADRNVPVR